MQLLPTLFLSEWIKIEGGSKLQSDAWSKISERNKVDQSYIFEEYPTGDAELLQTLFLDQNLNST